MQVDDLRDTIRIEIGIYNITGNIETSLSVHLDVKEYVVCRYYVVTVRESAKTAVFGDTRRVA